MKYLIKIILLTLVFAFGASVIYADQIEGSWRIDEAKMKKVLLAMPKNDQGMFAFLLLGVEELVFYKNGKVSLPKASQVGTWKKMKKGYQLTVDGESNQVFLDHGNLKLTPPAKIAKQIIIYNRQKTHSKDSSKNDAKIAKMIQYGHRYYRTTRQADGSETFLVVGKNNTCTFVTLQSNAKGKSKSKLSDKCHVMNGHLQMGPILGNAKVVSSKMIKTGKFTYILR
ncbi:MAG TPA: hypothetical protein EYH38_03065 [Leucothrix sp.]|nr:hypothetical protein [Leucothrix sp.]